MTSLSPELQLLLDDCRSEAKRWGAADVNVLHLALVVARREPEDFDKRFGSDARGEVQRRLSTGRGPDPTGTDVIALLESAPRSDPTEYLIDVLENKLGSLAPEAEPAEPPAPTERDVAEADSEADEVHWALPSRTARYLELVAGDPDVIGRAELVDDLLALIGRCHPVTPLLIGAAGSGRTSVIAALAQRLADPAYTGPLAGAPVVRVRPDALVAGDRSNALRRIVEDIDERVVVVIDDLEVIAGMGSHYADADMLAVVRGATESPSARLVLTIDDAYAARLDVHDHELSREVVRLTLPPLGREQLEVIVGGLAGDLADHHGVRIPDDIVTLALSPRAGRDVLAHPGLAASRLDGACARASIRGADTVDEADLRLEETPEIAAPDSSTLAERLRQRVLGQDDAVDRVSERLALTRAQLDLRPDRPDGVFLFVGPTGVGKTELARSICLEMYGDIERLIRLDMSEYAQDWALSRLVGPQPGYVGFTEPESWLTTRVIHQPETVILLDEIEKAHPAIWNAFLQVMDAGRLSDARGNVADFSRTVIAMTSNLGARAFGTNPLGFGPRMDPANRTETERDSVLDTVKDTMLPELINRLDDIVVFRPLTQEAICDIAAKEVETALDRLRDRGYHLEVDAGVVELIAEAGYDPAYGARHLHRNLERLLLRPLATTHDRQLSASVAGDAVVWKTPNDDELERRNAGD